MTKARLRFPVRYGKRSVIPVREIATCALICSTLLVGSCDFIPNSRINEVCGKVYVNEDTHSNCRIAMVNFQERIGSNWYSMVNAILKGAYAICDISNAPKTIAQSECALNYLIRHTEK